jgi:hypothetical protein
MAKLQGVKLSEALRKKQANRSSNNYKPQKKSSRDNDSESSWGCGCLIIIIIIAFVWYCNR